MHQITVIEPKWLSEVAPTFFRVADQNRISKRKQNEKIEPLYDRFAADKDDWVRDPFQSQVMQMLTPVASQQTKDSSPVITDIWTGWCTLVVVFVLFVLLNARGEGRGSSWVGLPAFILLQQRCLSSIFTSISASMTASHGYVIPPVT
jgi:hypothetical protein